MKCRNTYVHAMYAAIFLSSQTEVHKTSLLNNLFFLHALVPKKITQRRLLQPNLTLINHLYKKILVMLYYPLDGLSIQVWPLPYLLLIRDPSTIKLSSIKPMISVVLSPRRSSSPLFLKLPKVRSLALHSAMVAFSLASMSFSFTAEIQISCGHVQEK